MKIKQHLHQYVSHDSAPEVRLQAAQLKVSFSTEDEITVLCVLSRDPIRRIAMEAKKSLDEMPEPLLLAALETNLDHEVLKMLSIMVQREKCLVKILQNKNTDDDTKVKIAATGSKEVLKELLTLEDLKGKMPIAYGAMEKNPLYRETLKELAAERSQAPEAAPQDILGTPPSQQQQQAQGGFGGLLDDIKGDQKTSEAKAKSTGQGPGNAAPDTIDFNAAAMEASKEVIPVEAPEEYEIGDVEDTTGEKSGDGTNEIEDYKPKNTFELIKTLSVGQKIKLALTGGKEARDALIKDSNKLVAGGVIKNPQISDNEIIKVASTNGTSEDILRQIARNRQFMANYTIKHAIISNPKTPMQVSMRLMPTLNKKDKEKLAKSRSVPSAVSALAKKLATAKH